MESNKLLVISLSLSKKMKKYSKFLNKTASYGALQEGAKVGRKRLDAKFRNRFDKRANSLRQVSLLIGVPTTKSVSPLIQNAILQAQKRSQVINWKENNLNLSTTG